MDTSALWDLFLEFFISIYLHEHEARVENK